MRLHRLTRRQTIGRGPQAMTMSRTCSTAPSAPPGAAEVALGQVQPRGDVARSVTGGQSAARWPSRTPRRRPGRASSAPGPAPRRHLRQPGRWRPPGWARRRRDCRGPSSILLPGRTCGSKSGSRSRSWLEKKKLALLGYWLVVVAKPITSPVWFMISVPIGGAWVSCLGWNRLKACPASCDVRRNAAGTSSSGRFRAPARSPGRR